MKIVIFREEFAGFHAGPLSWSNWNLEMLVFVEGGKLANPEKNPRSKAGTNSKLNPHIAPGRNRTWGTRVGGERSHRCATPALAGTDISLLGVIPSSWALFIFAVMSFAMGDNITGDDANQENKRRTLGATSGSFQLHF